MNLIRNLMVLCCLLSLSLQGFSKDLPLQMLEKESVLTSKSLQQQESPSSEPLPEGATVIMEKDLRELGAFAQECNTFAEACANRNTLLEAYKKEADQIIANQQLKNGMLDEDLSHEKRKNNILYPILGVALGFLGGAFIIKK